MIELRLSEICAALGLPEREHDPTITSIVADSRRVEYGSLFAALPGNQVDGHDFARSATEMGALALLVERRLDIEIAQLVVEDVLLALGRIASLLRQKLNPLVIGITGSNGKTTVKEMLFSILQQQHGVLATEGNYNNELGVPLTLFRLAAEDQFAVLELGASKQGDIAYLAEIAQPDIGLITNIGPAHLEGFGNEQGVAQTKGELFGSLPAGGCAIFNGDQSWAELWKKLNTAANSLSFGENAENDVRLLTDAETSTIQTDSGEFELELKLPGKHNLINAAAATAAALALDIPLADIRRGLEAVKPVPGRLNLIRVETGWTVIDDTYNANPASLYSALQVLAGMQGTAWLVLGDMKELGENSRKLHAEVGDASRVLGVSRVFATGDLSELTVDAFGQGAQHFTDQAALVAALLAELRPGINCLVKGSRSMGMERIVNAITSPNSIQEAC
jgi:UDP-N-acetylmuramoyl-tripeptide--D-alanyl-D-alanine ligase